MISVDNAARASRVLAWMAVCLIAVLSLVPGSSRPHVLFSGLVEHAVAYALTAALLAVGYSSRTSIIRIAVLLPTYAAVLEVLQLWVPGRIARLIDVAAGTIGAWTGLGILMLMLLWGRWRTDRPLT